MSYYASGLLGISGLLGGVIILLIAQHVCPLLTNVLYFIAGIAMVFIVILVFTIILFALKRTKET